jgi:hypothetical protein
LEDYWEKKLLPPPAPPNIGRVKRGLPFLAQGRTWLTAKDLVFHLNHEQAQMLSARARNDGVTPFMLVNAAFLETVMSVGSCDDVLHSVTLGRSDGPLSSFAGHHTRHPLMRHQRSPRKSLAEIAHAASEELHQTLQNIQSRASVRCASWDQRLLEAGSYPRQITTGIPSPSARIDASPFARLFSLGAGTTLKIGSLELTKLVLPHEPGDFDELAFRPNFGAKGGVLEFKYDTEAFDDTDIAELADGTFSRLGLKLQEKRTGIV